MKLAPSAVSGGKSDIGNRRDCHANQKLAAAR